MGFRFFLIVFGFFLGAAPALADGVLYDCTITETRQGGGWISEKMAIVLTDDGKAVVSDAVILHFVNKPMEVRINRNTNRKLVVRWRLNGIVNSHNQTTPSFEYSATMTKPSNKISVYASPEGYNNRFFGKGSCIEKVAR